ncbi:MAG: glutamine--fructose-6-phosphate transaminase (isomerizing), partial [Neisseriaceae bacterium]|nr:glutamine--fructose-6-phosphate transaminase (isomerizing) [Neisseriaceae bacterium]
MCGIVGAVRREKNAADFLIDGLQRLEYRGYDSSGIAVLTADGKIQRIRRVGRVAEMADACRSEQVFGTLGIGHTRWATHGGVTEPNAHPHISGSLIAVVHNGIIENFAEERERLQNAGYTFSSQTDTEVIAHAVHQEYIKNNDLFTAVKTACCRFQGAYAIGVIAADKPNELVAVRMGCPLLVALGENENFIASDVSAVIAHTRKVMYLQDGDAVKLSPQGIDLMTDLYNQPISREIKLSELSLSSLELGEFSHFMQKEIHEQPQALTDTIKPLLNENFAPEIFGENAHQLFNGLKGIKILACGTSFYAALTAKYWLESIAKIPTDAEIASEYRYREVIADPDILVITISQSGETLDTMEALKYAQKLGHNRSLSICNVMESALPRESCAVFYTRAGAEIGVASTKAFTTQLVALFGLAVCLGAMRGLIDDTQKQQYAEELRRLPNSVRHALNL